MNLLFPYCIRIYYMYNCAFDMYPIEGKGIQIIKYINLYPIKRDKCTHNMITMYPNL